MSTVARPGGRPRSATNASTPCATSARTRAATALPSMTWAAMERATYAMPRTGVRFQRGAQPAGAHLAHERPRFGNNRSAMSRRKAAALVFLAILVAAPAVAHARVLVGIGDQKPAMFSDPRFRWLGVKRARIVVSWDVQSSPIERAWVKGWLAAARADRVQPLVAFGHAWSGKKRKYLPGVHEYRAAFLRFRRAYPWIHEYTAWNEANHCSQPTCHRPDMAAHYYDVVRDACATCKVVAADVLDQPNMPAWIRAFLRAAQHKPTVWGLHNYLDANRLRTTGTMHLLRAVRGQVWITETGGGVRRHPYRPPTPLPESASHAA